MWKTVLLSSLQFAPMIERLTAAFEANAAAGRERGAALCVYCKGELILSLCCGTQGEGRRAWDDRTLVPIFSATKAASAACLLTALYECAQGPELEVGALWPEFPAPSLTIGELLSHQAGLSATDEPASIFELEACKHALERSTPQWAPPHHGYHPHTYGPMSDVLMLALTGQRISDWWEERVRRPLGLDFYIGHVPEKAYDRVATLEHAKLRAPLPSSPFFRAYFDPQNPVYRAFHCIVGLDTVQLMSTPAAWLCGCPAKGGVASAAGLSLFYQALMGNIPASPFPSQVLTWMRTPMASGYDETLLEPTSFTCGAMCEPAELFSAGGEQGFGYAGAGGSLAFCLPQTGLSLAYVMNRMEPGVLPGERVRALLRAMV